MQEAGVSRGATGAEATSGAALASSEEALAIGDSDRSPRKEPAPIAESADVAVVNLFRAATVLAILFDILMMSPGISSPSRTIVLMRLFIISTSLVGFLLTFTTWFGRNWRPLAFAICFSWGVACASIALIDHDLNLLCWEVVLLATGTGALLPWQLQWQGTYLAGTLTSYGIVAALIPSHDGQRGVRYAVMLTAAGIGALSVALGDRHRRQTALAVLNMRREAARRERAIAELKRTYRQLQQSENKLRKVFEASPDTICIASLVDGRFIDINRESLLDGEAGYKREEALGSSTRDLRIWVDPDERERFLTMLAASGAVQNFEADLRLKDGSVRTCVISGSRVEVGDEPCVISVTSDISNIKRTERELIFAREAALAASRAKSEFLSNMSHELRTPMNAILGMTDLLGETPLNPEQQRFLATMSHNGGALLDLINSILDLAKIESGRLRSKEVDFDLEELIERLTETLGLRAHEKKLELAARIMPDVPLKLVGDQLRLRQVLINLVGNGIKFTDRGEVVLTVENEPGAPGMVRFAVRDTGIGIHFDQLEAIFESFTQADSSSTRKYSGSGLGLSIAKRLVELLDGRIWVESEIGTGSTFYFTARFGVEAGAGAAAKDPNLEGSRVLVVDSNATNRLIVKEVLARRGADVVEADDGDSALVEWQHAAANRRPYNLMLLDWRMPEAGEFVQRVKSEAAGGAVVPMLTSDDLHSKLSRLPRLGLEAYLVKPIKRSELFRAVAIAMGSVKAIDTQRRPQPSQPQYAADRRLNILLVEDSPDNRMLIRLYMKNLPYDLDQAENGAVAARKFTTGRYDIVLMDMRMAVMDGYTATREIRKWERENGRAPTPIVALTASALESDVRNCLEAGCTTHLSKPVKKVNLLDTIRELTHGSNGAHHGAEAPSPSVPARTQQRSELA